MNNHMNTLIEQIKKGQERASEVFMNYEKKIVDEHPLDWQKQFLISLLEGEREQLDNERQILKHMECAIVGNKECDECLVQTGRNHILCSLLSHIDEALAYLKTNV